MSSSEERTEQDQEPQQAQASSSQESSSATASSDGDDLIGQMMGEESSPRPSSDLRMVEDVVGVLDEIAAAHGKFCTFESFINPFGQVYCLSCGTNVGSVVDISDSFCPKCGCPNSAHMNGKCLMAGCPCSDSHEFQQTNFERQTKEAKQWLAKRKQRAETRTS